MFLKKDHKKVESMLDQIDEIVLNIQQLLDHSKIILCTSPRHIEEKPYITSEIAATYARQGKRVLLIDTNFYFPLLHTIFQLSNSYGLSNLLLKRHSDWVPENTSIQNLFLLPSGPLPYPGSKWTLQYNLIQLLEECREKYDHIFLNTPPVLEKLDTKILAAACDGIILFLKKNKTKKEDTLKAIEQIKKEEDKFIGSIFLT
ncbi:CpsD/CapB family tyrosine-protein kinase [Metabacillus fastidiosus]|uniref:CpsD/CapB family tyrosine-protein kinase n=1 Tax=Metabacillus fastidiosus TaxID=1458 RepID=UPI002E23D01B|nr:CpsD/CapB family tyrosine-protein kinase [Metabacillus fastidiosus]